MKATLRLSCFVLTFLLIAQFGFAQGAATGDLHVTVKDPTGATQTRSVAFYVN